MNRLKTLALLFLLMLGGPIAALPHAQAGGRTVGRLLTIGFEGQTFPAGNTGFEGATQGTTPVTVDTAFKRSGTASMKCTSGPAGQTAFVQIMPVQITSPGLSVVYHRGYFYFDNLPTSATAPKILSVFLETSAALASVRLTSAGKLQLFNDVAGTQIGSSSTATLVTGQWYRIELKVDFTNSTANAFELKLDGATVVPATATTLNALCNNRVNFGWITNPGNSLTLHVDDVAQNDSVGTAQNSYPGAGSVVLSKPISDNAVTGWTGGAGGTTDLFEAVNNTPPLGTTAALATDLTQIKDANVNATDNYDANMTDYTTAGVPTNATITLVQPAIINGANGTTGNIVSGAFSVTSNPTQVGENSFGFSPVNQTDDWTTGGVWRGRFGLAQVGDIASGNRGVSPVMRVGRRTALARETDFCFMGLMIEYVPGTASLVAYRLALMGVGH